ncbi:hypothetical protein [Paraferrimonas sedimenticola]|uniref:Choloylglycine hydrolase n=1 Tax=Paraferrimonas sedimenticola TaxID=375674 RepID=A0AA37W0G8_9GAMM|nr:hypothetical protein [Paraferrimonas sedimenticola]GLP96310.1 hypothetical protein GCM10007895_16160 [Paraferrimonas sedimenticola]
MKKTSIALAFAVAGFVGTVGVANACSKIAIHTQEHGVIQVRSLDWDTAINTVAKVIPLGGELIVNDSETYKNVLRGQAKYPTMAFNEHIVFHGTNMAARNDRGLIADILYQSASYTYLDAHVANQSASVNYIAVDKAPSTIAANYASVKALVSDLQSGKVDIGWGMKLGDGGAHGSHINVQDKHGDAVLLQLGEGGKTVVTLGKIATDADVAMQANEPLLHTSKEYLATFEAQPGDQDFLNQVPAGIRSIDRFARLQGMHALHTAENYRGKSELEAIGTLNGAFDQAANLAQFVATGSNVAVQQAFEDASGVSKTVMALDANGVYPTRVKYSHGLNSGYFQFDNTETNQNVNFNVYQVLKNAKTEICSDDLMKAANRGVVTWGECKG